LSRFSGLRCTSEHLSLKWSDVDWANNRITVHSPKTEHHEGGESRIIPLFPELLPHLRAAFEQAEPGTEYVISSYRSRKKNFRTRFQRIIRRAGLKPWPKLFQNLRAARETKLAEEWPLHVVCAWIGNSEAVAKRHYLQMRDDYFEQASKQDDKALQNPVQSSVESSRKVSSVDDERKEEAAFCGSLREIPASYDDTGTDLMGVGGLEPSTSRV
jgi:hypothetical protein